jgi:spore coat polysaccharide biosynthesis protein SpsF
MKTIAIVQARMGSQRLPGKVLRPLCGQSMIGHVLERAASAQRLDDVWLATSLNPENDALAAEVRRLGFYCFRGSEDDVLARYQGAAEASGADVIVRITGDCPLYDPALCDAMLEQFHQALQEKPSADFMSNVSERHFPRGLDTEIFTAEALARNYREAKLPEEREHVTLHIHRHPEKFRILSFKNEIDLSRFRWTVDTIEDWHFVEAVYKSLWRNRPLMSTADILALLERRPDIVALNAEVQQKPIA